MCACSISAGAARLDRFDSLLGSIGTRCMCHRVPPCKAVASSCNVFVTLLCTLVGAQSVQADRWQWILKWA
eukprot:11895177-Alexandrium_andersonii.AAC.1